MLPERIEKLKQEYTDKYVAVDEKRPVLARFQGMIGQVKTINFNGRALVEFDGQEDRGWYDVELDYLRVVDKPEANPPAEKGGKAAAKAEAKTAGAPIKKKGQEKLSPLELARMEKQAAAAAQAPEGSDPSKAEAGQKSEKRPAESSRNPAQNGHSDESDSK